MPFFSEACYLCVTEECDHLCVPQCGFTKYDFETTWTKFPSRASNQAISILTSSDGEGGRVPGLNYTIKERGFVSFF